MSIRDALRRSRFPVALLLFALLAQDGHAVEAPTVTLQMETSLPLGKRLSGSVALEWEDASTEIMWAPGFFEPPDVSVSSEIRFGDLYMVTRLDEVLAKPTLTAGLGIRRGPMSIDAGSTWRIAVPSFAFDGSSLSLAFRPDDAVSLRGRLRLGESRLTATIDIDARTAIAYVALHREWAGPTERRTTYTLDVPAIGLGLTYAIRSGEAGHRAETSWHPVLRSFPDTALAAADSSSTATAAFDAQTKPLDRPSCQVCSVVHPSADSSDHTIGFGEAMVGEETESGLILNCPYHVFCWLSSVTDAPSPPFSITYAPIGMTIPIGSERRLELAFAPTSPGTYQDSMTIRYCVAYWVEPEEDGVIADIVDHVTGYYTYRCSSYTFPLAGVGLAKPEARATYSPNSPTCGKEVAFDGSGSFDPNPEGAIASYHWEFGDGGTSTLARPTHRFSRAGRYDVKLTVQNNREMPSDPYTLSVEVSPDYLETAATIGAAAAAGWATHASTLAAPLLAAAVPGTAIAVSSIIAKAGAARFPIDQLVVRLPQSWDFQDLEELVTRNIPGAQVIGFFSSLHAFLIHLPLSSDSPEAAKAELAAHRETLAKITPPGTQLGKNYLGEFEGAAYQVLRTDIESLDNDFRVAYETVRAPEAWRRITASDVRLRPVRVAVIDTGIDASHAEFTIPLRGRSYVVEQAGSQPWYEDQTGHGTQISGIIGAENGRGRVNGMLTGCAGQYEMQVYRVIGDMFTVWDSLRLAVSRTEEELEALSAAVEFGTRRKSVVVNMSLGWDLENLPDAERVLTRNAFLDLFDRYPETLFVSSAGNGDRPDDVSTSTGKPLALGSGVHAPGGLNATNNLTVAATNAAGTELMSWSNYGPAVDIAAPGYEVYTANKNGEYTWRVAGSSYAAAMVSGAAAAVRAIDPRLSPAEVKAILTSSTSRVRTPDGRLIPVLDFADAVSKAMDSRIARNRRTLWWAAGCAGAILGAGLLLLRPF